MRRWQGLRFASNGKIVTAEASPPWLSASGLTKTYAGVVALRDVALEMHAGEVRGLVGANGAGKSTLVKTLTGVTAPTAGAILADGVPLKLGSPRESLRAGIVSVPQELTVAKSMTVAENILLGHYPARPPGFLRSREMNRLAADVLERLDLSIPPGYRVGDLSLIFQRLVMVARAFSFRARLMIFDEPTATVTPREVRFLLDAIGALTRENVSILYVSHRLDEINEICTAVTVLRDGEVAAELKDDEVTHERLVEYLTAGSGPSLVSTPAAVSPRSHETVLEMKHVTAQSLDDVSLTVAAGEVVGLAGVAGSGTRELLLTVCGARPFSAGSVSLCGEHVRSGNIPAAVAAGIGFLPGDRSLAAFPNHSIRFNVSLTSIARHAIGVFVNHKEEQVAVKDLLERVSLQRDPELQISSLSGGNQQKAIVARWLGVRPALLLLDDPTAGVDVATRPEIHTQIKSACAEGTGVLLVSTDIDELVALSDRVLVLRNGSIREDLSGSRLSTTQVLAAMTGREEAPESGAGARA